jgi:AraC-like DNA-binding protein
MPQDRSTLAAGFGVRVERVVSHAAGDGWSAVYRTASTRLLLPDTGAVELRRAGGDLLADPLTAFALATREPYQLRPWQAGGPRATFVVSMDDESDASLPTTDAWLLTPAARFRLQCHWRDLEAGIEQVAGTMRLLPRLLRGSIAAPQREARQVRRARRMLVERPGARLSLDDLADAACTTPFHLARLFRRQTGWSLHQYRHGLRVAAALARLQAGERDLAGLAHDLGYSSQSHFGALFRRAVGVTPGEARLRLAD